MKQNKDYSLAGRLARILRPYYQLFNVKATIEFEWNYKKFYLTVEKVGEYKLYRIALDCYKKGVFQDELGISVEGHKHWKTNLSIFLELVSDNYGNKEGE